MPSKQTQNRFVKVRELALLFPLVFLLGCYSGSVKPLLNHSEFKAENQPIRTLRILLVTDNSYRKNQIEKFVSQSSCLLEVQVGIRLEIVDWCEIRWEDELDDIYKMEIRIAADTWRKRDAFDIALTFVYFTHTVEGGKLPLGAIDTFFWRYIFMRELDPYILLHELFHAFLLQKDHSNDWVMRAARPRFGSEWYWLTPEDRKRVLGNKWRDFNVMPVSGQEEQQKSREGWFYYNIGVIYFKKGEFNQAISLFDKCLRINPTYVPAYENRGIVYSSRQQYDQAIADFNKVLEIDPKYAPAYLNRGKAFYFKGEYEKSWEDVKKAETLGLEISSEFLENLRKASGRQN